MSLIKFFPGRLSKEIALELSQLSGIDAYSIKIDNKKNIKICQIIIFPILGDNELSKELDLWIESLKKIYHYALVILADEDENWRHRCVEFEIIRRLDQIGGRMIYEPLIIDSSQYVNYINPLRKWWAHVHKLLSCDLSVLHNFSCSMRISSNTMGYYHLDFRSQEYYQRKVTENPALVYKLISTLLDQGLVINGLIFKYMGIHRCMLPINIINDVSYLNVSCSNYLDLSLIEQFNLRTLNLTANSLTSVISLPNSTQSLSHLYLCKNNIENIDGIEKFQRLVWLSFYRNSIKKIESIGECTNLKYLNIGANLFKSIPKSFSSLINIETIQLRNSLVNEIPSHILDLPSLRLIVLKKCKNIPNQYIDDLKKSYSRIKIIHDVITHVPPP